MENYHPSFEGKELLAAILKLKNLDEARRFFRDLLTLAEIKEFANRLKMAKLLREGKSYALVAKLTKSSTTTVSRVAHWLFRGTGGYKLILNRLFPKQKAEQANH